jgi:uncharacterized protein (DUF885 family)
MIKKFKKTIAIALACAMMLSMSGCGQESMSGRKQDSDSSLRTESTEEDTEEQTELEVTTENSDFSEEDLAEQEAFEQYLDDYFEDQVTTDTLTYHYTVKDGSNFGIEAPELTLGDSDMSEEAIADEQASFEEQYAELLAINYNSLTKDQKFTYDVLDEYMSTESAVYDNIYLYEPFSPMNGLHANIATYFTDYSFYCKEDVEDYIGLLLQLPDYFQGYLDFEEVKAEKGYFMSDTSCDSVIEQCQTFIENKDEHFMIADFDARIDELDFLTDEEKEDFKARNKDAVLNGLIPAFENTIETFESLKGSGKVDGGICNYEGGKDYYAYLLKYRSGTSKTPEEVIDMLDEQMDTLIMQMYTVYMTNPDAYQYFADNYDTLFADADDMSVEQIIDTLMSDAMENYPDMGTIPYTAHYLDESLETIMENTLAYYMSPALDDPDNNIIYVNGLHMDGLWTTLAHEGCPGHMFQNAYYMSTDPEPVRTLYNFLGYKEGWAMYACYDAVSAYDFGNDEYASALAQLYQINDEISYLAMGRVDIGVNYEGWTVEDVESWLSEQGFGSDGAESIYDTVSGDPALYQSYVTGYYELKELRTYAEQELDDKFDVKAFNTVILDAGPCQYDLLKEKVDEYILNNR